MTSSPPPPAGWLPGRFRLGAFLRERAHALHGYMNLARAVHAAAAPRLELARLPDDATAGFVVDRRKLQRIAQAEQDNDDKTPMTLRELSAIDAFAESFDESLAHRPLFEKPEFLQPLADADEAEYLLGARLKDFHADLSHWDVEALRSVYRGVYRLNSRVRFHGHNVLRRSTVDEARAAIQQRYAELFRSGSSLVCIGSPRVSHMTEWMLSSMFGQEPLKRGGDVPIRFCWPDVEPDGARILPSAFDVTWDELASRHPGLARPDDDQAPWALETPAGVYVARSADGVDVSYGLIALQRREHGQAWLAVAGLNGPATYGAAKYLRRIGRTLRPTALGTASRVLWGVVEVGSSWQRGQLPEVSSERLLDGLHEWPVEDAT